MERKIGEIFECNGEWYQCVENDKESCEDCDFTEYCESYSGNCDSTSREDGKSICFKKLEKVGKPYMHFGRIVQRYKCVTTPVERPDEPYMIYYGGSHEIDIEIKNKENMEEKELNLKPFDLDKAKEGKPVCTRDGRKARIICFDMKADVYNIVALIDDGGEEIVCFFSENGLRDVEGESRRDLMMLPEKKHGYTNIYRNKNGDLEHGYIRDTIEEATLCKLNNALNRNPVYLEWEE